MALLQTKKKIIHDFDMKALRNGLSELQQSIDMVWENKSISKTRKCETIQDGIVAFNERTQKGYYNKLFN